jgi:hypothetical protein
LLKPIMFFPVCIFRIDFRQHNSSIQVKFSYERPREPNKVALECFVKFVFYSISPPPIIYLIRNKSRQALYTSYIRHLQDNSYPPS